MYLLKIHAIMYVLASFRENPRDCSKGTKSTRLTSSSLNIRSEVKCKQIELVRISVSENL